MAEVIATYPTPTGGHGEARPQRGEPTDSPSAGQEDAALAKRSRPVFCGRFEAELRYDVVVPLLPHRRRVAARRRAESLLVAVLSRRAGDDAGHVQAVDPRPSGLVQQLHGGLLGPRSDRRPDRRETAVRHAHPQDRRPSRSSATGSWPSPAHLAQLEARDSRPAANRRRSPRDVSRLPAGCSAPADMSRKRSSRTTSWTGRRERARPQRRASRVRDSCHGRRSRRQWSPWRGTIRRSCWERSVETLTARKDDIAGLAVASDERIEAYLLYVDRGVEGTEILSLRSFIEDGGARLKQLLSQLRAQGTRTLRFPKVHPAEISRSCWKRSVSAPPAGTCSTPRRRDLSDEPRAHRRRQVESVGSHRCPGQCRNAPGASTR